MSFKKCFHEEFQKLNSAQKEAVETIEGPLLIVAGPGTGKTQTLALRLANILQKTQAKPHNLLALTFTESGAIALKKRLASIIGSEAYGISAFTFHSFCARMQAMFPSEFATTRESIPINELRQIQLFREVFTKGEFPLLSPLRAMDLYLKDIQKALSSLKREGISPKKFLAILESEKEEFSKEERINPKTKKPYGKILQKEKFLAKNFELASFYEIYQKELEERGFNDFDDLILSVVEKLNSKDEFLLAYLQENFLYAMVDEFQDTNGAQNAILEAWGSFDAKPNLCVVGDDDQSIYRFQGASLANILEFHEKYPSAKIITLTQNYRSTQPILDVASSVIANNEERLVNKIEGISKNITSQISSKSSKPKVIEARSESDEVASVGGEIEKLVKAKTPLHEIACIYRNRKHGDSLASFLLRKGIPFFRADGLNALLNPRVKQLVKLLKTIEKPKDAIASLATFFADFANCDEVEVYKISKEVNFENTFLDVALASENKKVKAFAKKLLEFQKLKSEENLLEFIENVASESGLTQKITKNKEFESAEALNAFLAFVKNFALSSEDASLKNLLEDVTAMEKNFIAIKTPSRNHSAITLTTAHSAKGLEWENVFLIHADDNSWGGKGKREMLKLPNLLEVEEEKDAKIEDERRLFFVALTRAKTNLTISYAKEYEFREVSPSRFIEEIPSNLVEKIEAKSGGMEILPTPSSKKMSEDTQRFLRSLLDSYKLSPTALNNYLTCPKLFLFQNLLHIPTKVEVEDRMGMIFGNAMHQAFEDFFREFKNTQKLPSIEIAKKGLAKSLDREILTKKQRENLERDLLPALEKYFEFHHKNFQIPLEVEFNFAKHEVYLEEIPLVGKVDRIDFIPQSERDVRFVDYKSMQPLSRASIRGETANSSGNSYRQLLFYSLLAQLDSRFIFNPKELVISFVRSDAKGEFHDEVFSPKVEEIEELKKQIREVWKRIQKLEFDCDEDECGRCSFREICGK